MIPRRVDPRDSRRGSVDQARSKVLTRIPLPTLSSRSRRVAAAIRAAYIKAGEQKSFRARMVSDSGGKVSESTVEFVAPASMHMVMKTQNMEQIVIDGAYYMKVDGRWTRLPISTGNLIEQLRKDPAASVLERVNGIEPSS